MNKVLVVWALCAAIGRAVIAADWACSAGVTRAGDVLTCISKSEMATAWATKAVDLSPYDDKAFKVSVRCRGRNVSCSPGGAFKVMVQFDDAVTGQSGWPQAVNRTGSWDWQEVSFSYSLKERKVTRAIAYLGLQQAKGEVDFDLSTFKIEKGEPMGKPIKITFVGDAARGTDTNSAQLVARGLTAQTERKVVVSYADSGVLELEYRNWAKTCDLLQGVVSNRPEIVVLAYGDLANDLTNAVNISAYARTCRRAVRMMKDAGARVVVCPPNGNKPLLNEMLERLAREEHVLIANSSNSGQSPAERILAALAPQKIAYPPRVTAWPRMLKGVMLNDEPCEQDFADLAAMGATLVRYQMIGRGWKQHHLPGGRERYDAWVDNRLDLLERLLPWGRKYGIKICVDNHYLPGGHTAEEYSSSLMYKTASYGDWLVDMWRKTARRMKGNWDVLYGYDIINESMDRESASFETCWRAVFTRCCDAIRAEDPEATLVIEPNCHASPYGFETNSRYGFRGFAPLPYDNAIYQVHMYVPMEFTHQGLFVQPGKYKPVKYPDEKKGWTKEWVRKQLDSLRQFQLATGARIYAGEFSAPAYAPGAAQYLKDLTDIFREYGWDWTYHAFRESHCWSFEHEGPSFHELRPATAETDRAKVIKAALKAESRLK